ncbi:hypothetical protein ANCDUO_17304 [Ancylostoma duodenale]|uniref:Uncharacterized protein n=1 Tax=Ancylostoma duodenale TaxID=51022 RepID=A0A0C2G683_9BILA|nr:hypothetical protein ANCDUO_17304 [Ancylostoma duodenale]
MSNSGPISDKLVRLVRMYILENKEQTEEWEEEPEEPFPQAREQGKTIGLVVDLTNTDRYYKKTDWENYNVKYM